MPAPSNGLGYLPDEVDTRDHRWGSPLRGRGTSASLEPYVLNVLNQGQLGSCVANAGYQAIRMRQVRQGLPEPLLGSRLFGYWACRAAEHTTKFDTGTHLRTFFDVCNKFGFPPEVIWPYDARDDGDPNARFRRQPSTAAFTAAFDLRSPTVYQRIEGGPGAPEQVAQALWEGYPVAFGIDVSNAFARDDFDPHIPIGPAEPQDVAGGHAMVFAGFDGDRFRGLNSWGPGWGDGGYFWASKKFVEAARDIWVVKHAPMPMEKP